MYIAESYKDIIFHVTEKAFVKLVKLTTWTMIATDIEHNKTYVFFYLEPCINTFLI